MNNQENTIINSIIRQMMIQRYLQELKMNDPQREKRAMLGSARPWTEADRVELDSAGPFQQSSRSNPATGYNEGQERRDATTTASGGEISFNRQGPWYAGRNIPIINTPLANELRSTVDMGRRAEAGARESADLYDYRTTSGFERGPSTPGTAANNYRFELGALTAKGQAERDRFLAGSNPNNDPDTPAPSASSFGPGPNSEIQPWLQGQKAPLLDGRFVGQNPMGNPGQGPGGQSFDFAQQRAALPNEPYLEGRGYPVNLPQTFPFYLSASPAPPVMDAGYFQRDPFQPSPASRIRPAWADLAW